MERGAIVMDTKAIKENDIVKVINPNKTMVDGQIMKVSSDYLVIKMSIKQNAYINLYKDQLIELILIYMNEAIRCNSVILGSKQEGSIQIIIISIPKLIFKIQRREFERLPIVIPADYLALPSGVDFKNINDFEQTYSRLLKKAYTIDISAGGVNMSIRKNEEFNTSVIIIFSISNEKIISLCRRVRTDPTNDSFYDNVAFMYDDIKDQHRQLILDFVTEKLKRSNI